VKEKNVILFNYFFGKQESAASLVSECRVKFSILAFYIFSNTDKIYQGTVA